MRCARTYCSNFDNSCRIYSELKLMADREELGILCRGPGSIVTSEMYSGWFVGMSIKVVTVS